MSAGRPAGMGEGQVSERRVRDIMLRLDAYATVAKGATIEQALAALAQAQLSLSSTQHPHRAVLVLNSDGEVCGKLSHWAILRTLEPHLFGAQDLASLERANLSEELVESLKKWSTDLTIGLERICRLAATVKVEDAMVPVGESIDEDELLSAAVHRFVRSRAQSLLVRRDGSIIGIVRLSDVFEEVSRLILEGGCLE